MTTFVLISAETDRIMTDPFLVTVLSTGTASHVTRSVGQASTPRDGNGLRRRVSVPAVRELAHNRALPLMAPPKGPWLLANGSSHWLVLSMFCRLLGRVGGGGALTVGRLLGSFALWDDTARLAPRGDSPPKAQGGASD